MLKAHASVGSVALAFALAAAASPGLAQTGPTAPDPINAAAPMPNEAGIGEIIVTAQRRAESVQKSSLAISVLNAETAAGITDARDLSTLVPGVQISQGGATLQTYIRGVGDFGSSALNQSAVSFNVDGVYAADTAAVSSQFFDLDRVEILKGPQGTLYGRNASAGSVNLVFKRPRLGEISGDVIAEYGNFDYIHAGAAANVPLGEKAALRGSVNYVDRDGYLSDGTNDDKQLAGRLQMMVRPFETISLRLIGDLARRDGRGPGSVLIPRQAGNDRFTGAINPRNNAARLAVSPFAFTPGAGLPPRGQTGLLRDTFIDVDQGNIGAELDWDLGFANLTFLPAYRDSRSSIGSYISGSVFLNQERNKQTSYELRLSHDAGWGNVILGAYYLDLDQVTSAQVFTASFITANQTADLGTESIAGFGQATINLTDRLRVIGGVRYTNEDRTIDASDFTNRAAFDSGVTFKKWTWRGGAEYDLAPQNMAYVTVSKGFKSGGFNIFAPTSAFSNVYEPETLFSYAAGLRNRFLDNRIQFNVEAFYWDYRDSQQNALQFTPAGALQFSTFNAASATLYGADADLIVKPSSAGTFSATLSYLHTKFDAFVLAVPLPTNPQSNGCAINNAVPPFTIDCSGFRLPRAPRWSGTTGYEHVLEFGADALTLGGNLDFASSRALGINYVSNERAKAFVRFNADVTYAFGDRRYAITAFVKNITDREVPVAGNQAALTPNLIYAQVGAPRTYGVRFTGRF